MRHTVVVVTAKCDAVGRVVVVVNRDFLYHVVLMLPCGFLWRSVVAHPCVVAGGVSQLTVALW